MDAADEIRKVQGALTQIESVSADMQDAAYMMSRIVETLQSRLAVLAESRVILSDAQVSMTVEEEINLDHLRNAISLVADASGAMQAWLDQLNEIGYGVPGGSLESACDSMQEFVSVAKGTEKYYNDAYNVEPPKGGKE